MEIITIINEGGNAVKNVSRIYQENVKETLASIEKALLPLLNVKNYKVLGSTGKKNPGGSSGDIDIAIDINEFIKNNGASLTTYEDVFSLVEEKVKALPYNYKPMRSLGIISVAWPIQTDYNANKEYWQDGQFVQVDIMLVKNLKLAEWSFYSPAEWESKWKGLYRNELLYSIAKYMDLKVLKKAFDKEGKEVDVEWERYMFSLKDGLLKAKQGRAINKNGDILKSVITIEKQLVTDDIEKIVEMLFGPNVKPTDVLTYDDTIKFILSPNFIYKDKRDKILKMAAEGIKRNSYLLPPELVKYA